jgi:hypothetical protein
MSSGPPSLSPDLARLRDEGYEVQIAGGHVVVRNVPYVTTDREVAHADLIDNLAGTPQQTAAPANHVVFWTGSEPCDQDGTPMGLSNAPAGDLGDGLVAQYSFSWKPDQPDPDFFEKMTRYVAMIEGPARDIDPDATAQTWQVQPESDPESPFLYPDTASSRAGVSALSTKVRRQRLAQVGLGGSGAYLLDLLAKTQVAEIHLFDGDDFLSHNAFRAPGAASLEELNARPNGRPPKKVEYLASIYSKMRRGIEPHPYPIGPDNLEELQGFDFVFLCMDGGATKGAIVEALNEWGMSFIDVGMGLSNKGEAIDGILAITTSTPGCRDHVDQRIDFADPNPGDIYEDNIQIADLNALNATLASIKWKKLNGIYADLEHEHYSAYTLDGNDLANDNLKAP